MFERQWFGPNSQNGLTLLGRLLEDNLIRKNYTEAWNLLTADRHSKDKKYIKRQGKRVSKITTRGKQPVFIIFDGFWPGFRIEKSLVWQIALNAARRASLTLEITEEPYLADICISSCFARRFCSEEVSHCTHILYLGENVRPCYSLYDYSITSDCFDYLGRNSYLPVWLSTLYSDCLDCTRSSDLELSADFAKMYLEYNDLFSMPWNEREKGVAYIGNNNEPLRISTISALESSGIKVQRFGSSSNPIKNKQDVFGKYSHVLCPENSYYPGYITEKLIHSAFSGAISLYWGGIPGHWCQALGDRIIDLNSTSISCIVERIASSSPPSMDLRAFASLIERDRLIIIEKLNKWMTCVLRLYC